MADPVFLKAPDGNYVWFEWNTEKNDGASTKEGRPMFDKVLMMHVVSPGAPKSSPVHVVERQKPGEEAIFVEFFKRYRAQIDAFKADETGGVLAGTPLEQLPFLDMATRATMRAMHIYTAEALSELPENGIQNLGMGARQWKQEAVAFLEAAKGGAPVTRLIADNERLTAENERMADTIKQLARRMDDMEKGIAPIVEKRGPGRPPKDREAA